MAGALEGDIFIGPKAEEHRGLLSIKYPMEHGIVTNWNDMEKIWTYIYRFSIVSNRNLSPDEFVLMILVKINSIHSQKSILYC